MSSFLSAIDIGLRALLYTKFYDLLDLDNINTGVVFYPREIAPRKVAEKRGEATSEFINVWRVKTGSLDWRRQTTAIARRGVSVGYTDVSETDGNQIKAIATSLEYNIWFWSKKVENLNLVAERFLFWQHSDPNLNLSYLDEYPLELDLHFTDLLDESDISNQYLTGPHYIMRGTITLDGWVFTVPTSVKAIHSIHLTVYDKDDLTETAEYEEIIVEDSNQDTELAETLKLYTRVETF